MRSLKVKHLVGVFYAICVEALCMIIASTGIMRKAEDPEDMGMFEAMIMLAEINNV